MRNLKLLGLHRLIAFLTILVIISSSCKNDELTPNYEGKWVTEKAVPGSSGYVSVNYYLKFSHNEFEETFLDINRSGLSNSRFIAIEGSISTTENIMTFTAKKISFSYYDTQTSTASEPYETYTDKDQNFDLWLDGLVLPTSTHQVEFGIVDNQLILKIDFNEDGSYSENEKLVYTKQ